MARMREAKVRFGESAWELVHTEAAIEGESVSQFVREAAIVRALLARLEREPELRRQWSQVLSDLRR